MASLFIELNGVFFFLYLTARPCSKIAKLPVKNMRMEDLIGSESVQGWEYNVIMEGTVVSSPFTGTLSKPLTRLHVNGLALLLALVIIFGE